MVTQQPREIFAYEQAILACQQVVNEEMKKLFAELDNLRRVSLYNRDTFKPLVREVLK